MRVSYFVLHQYICILYTLCVQLKEKCKLGIDISNQYDTKYEAVLAVLKVYIRLRVSLETCTWEYSHIACPCESKFENFYSLIVTGIFSNITFRTVFTRGIIRSRKENMACLYPHSCRSLLSFIRSQARIAVDLRHCLWSTATRSETAREYCGIGVVT